MNMEQVCGIWGPYDTDTTDYPMDKKPRPKPEPNPQPTPQPVEQSRFAKFS